MFDRIIKPIEIHYSLAVYWDREIQGELTTPIGMMPRNIWETVKHIVAMH